MYSALLASKTKKALATTPHFTKQLIATAAGLKAKVCFKTSGIILGGSDVCADSTHPAPKMLLHAFLFASV